MSEGDRKGREGLQSASQPVSQPSAFTALILRCDGLGCCPWLD